MLPLHARLLFLLFVTVAGVGEDFITDFEYGQMLYRDPHGASCAACHGDTGSGKIIAAYTDRQGQIRTIRGPDIRHATLEQIRQSVRKGSGVMPRYFLTDKEIQTLHAYLQEVNHNHSVDVAKLFTKQSAKKTARRTPLKSAE